MNAFVVFHLGDEIRKQKAVLAFNEIVDQLLVLKTGHQIHLDLDFSVSVLRMVYKSIAWRFGLPSKPKLRRARTSYPFKYSWKTTDIYNTWVLLSHKEPNGGQKEASEKLE